MIVVVGGKSVASYTERVSGMSSLRFAREELCAALEALGVKAVVSERGRTEERIARVSLWRWGHRSLGIIDTSPGPIRWINLRYLGPVYTDDRSEDRELWDVQYGVPDINMSPAFPKVRIRRAISKSFFWFTTRSNWKGNDFGRGLISRLAHPPFEPYNFKGVTIAAYPVYKCWVLSIRTEDLVSWGLTTSFSITKSFIPTRVVWDFLVSTANVFLTTLAPPET
jgi:hypothetical protein